MKVLIIIPPILKSEYDPYSFLTVPPDGYGGVENVVYALTQGLVHLKHEVTIIGAPGSRSMEGITIIRDILEAKDIKSFILNNYKKFDVIHDHSGGLIFDSKDDVSEYNYVATHHMTGESPYPSGTIFLSESQRDNTPGSEKSSIVRIPVIKNDYIFNDNKKDFLLYLGRVSEWKGVYESLQLSKSLNLKLIIAGPSWEKDYFERIEKDFNSEDFEYVGNVSGLKRLKLISDAKAVFALSRFRPSPWGGIWHEPGSTIVSESGISGTPIISSKNGCLDEIVVDGLNGIKLSEEELSSLDTSRIDFNSFNSNNIRDNAVSNWDHIKITSEYIKIYENGRK